MLAVIFVYAGLAAMLTGALTFAKPLAFVRIPNRRRASAVFGGGLLTVAVGMLLPAIETRITVRGMRLDEFAPVYQFNEVHTVRVSAPRARVYHAIKAVTADEILFFRTLTWIRRLGRRGPRASSTHRSICQSWRSQRAAALSCWQKSRSEKSWWGRWFLRLALTTHGGAWYRATLRIFGNQGLPSQR